MERSVEEALCSLQAQLHVHRLALQAFIGAHHAPDQLLEAWRKVLKESPSYVPLAPADVRHSALLREQCHAYLEDWTAELVELAAPAATAPMAPAAAAGS
ncbi:MAG: hypothetical protein ACREO0_11450 [Pseudoxanthomonas sp.]